VTPTISAAQRDALYDQILDRLGGIGDIELKIESKDYSAAKRLGREYSNYLLLLLDDLGIGDGTGESVELTSPPDVLCQALSRLRELAIAHNVSQQREWAAAQELKNRNRLVSEACTSVLADLGGTRSPAANAERTAPIVPPGR
jgi:hypothetical protein